MLIRGPAKYKMPAFANNASAGKLAQLFAAKAMERQFDTGGFATAVGLNVKRHCVASIESIQGDQNEPNDFCFPLLILSAASFPPLHQDNQKKLAVVQLTVIGLKNNIGDVKVGLFNSAESFDGETKEKFAGAVVKIQNRKIRYLFPAVPYGEYAIKLFHDEDGDDEIDTNFLGIPTESYGFSNNARGFFGPPSFEKAKFIVSSDTVRVEISVD